MLIVALSVIGTSVASAATPLDGTFTIVPGANPPGSVGSYFRMILPGGSVNSGFIKNTTSDASDQTYTYLLPGTDGGLVTGGYQPEPNPAFDNIGNSLATRIISPTAFIGKNFSAASSAVDPQTGIAVAAPTISDDGSGHLSGDLRAFGAAWNKQEFNQGVPKPDGALPGLTGGPTGTYNSLTGEYTLDWTSKIVGGPFDGFTGKWHLAGIFVPRVTPSATPSATHSATPSATHSATSTSTPFATQTATPTATIPPAPACVGDCDGTGQVTVDEIVRLVNIALGDADAANCSRGIPDGASVDVAVIIQAVGYALNSCPTLTLLAGVNR